MAKEEGKRKGKKEKVVVWAGKTSFAFQRIKKRKKGRKREVAHPREEKYFHQSSPVAFCQKEFFFTTDCFEETLLEILL